MVSDIVLSSALRSTLNSLNRTQNTIDVITQRLASGLKVNSALDQPDNYFTARTLRFTASDHSRLLDGIGQSIRSVQEALIGLEAVENLIDLAETVTTKSKEALLAGETDPAVFEKIVNTSPPPLSTQILQGTPDVYYRLNETAGPIVDYGSGAAGPVNAVYNNGASANAPALYTNGAAPSVEFDGINDRIRVADSTMINLNTTTARTVELVFNADDVTSRQVLYEEGATVNGLTIMIDGGNVYVVAEDDGSYNNIFLNAPIVTGQTYHVAFVFDALTDTFDGYLNGVQMGPTVNLPNVPSFPSHSGDIGIGGVNGGVQFYDGEDGTGNGYNFDGRISDVAIYNRALSSGEILSHGTALNSSTSLSYENSDYNALMNQLDLLIMDAHYRGINLLGGENLRTFFNSQQTSFLVTKGEDFSTNGLGLTQRNNFNNLNDLENILDALRAARAEIRTFAFTLTTDLSIIETRNDFTRENINTRKAGADDLTLADMNEESANQLAAQTRLELGVSALSLAAVSQASILTLVSDNN